MPVIKKGAYKINDVINVLPYETLQLGAGGTSYDEILEEYGFDVDLAVLNLDSGELIVPFEIGRISPANTFGDVYIDGAPPKVFYEYIVCDIGLGTAHGEIHMEPEYFPGVTFNIPKDTAVNDITYNWFIENTKPIIKAGVYKFKDSITVIPYDVLHFMPSSIGYARCLEEYGFDITPVLEDGYLVRRLSIANTFSDIYVDGVPTTLCEEIVCQADLDGVSYVDGVAVSYFYGREFTIPRDTEVNELTNTWFHENVESVALTVKQKIRNLIAKANSTTGNSDTDLTAGVNALIEGYGQGDQLPEWDKEYELTDDVEDAVTFQEKTITENGEYSASADGVDGYSKVIVTVPKNESGGNVDINGIVREYKVNAGANVNAGDFVEFITRYDNGIFENYNMSNISTCKLDNNRVLVTYKETSDNRCMAVVLGINNNETIIGDAVMLCGANVTSVSVEGLTESKAIIAYADGSTGSAFANILTISEFSITVGTPTEYYLSESPSYRDAAIARSITVLDSETVMICQRISSNGVYGGYCKVYFMNINGETATNIATTSLSEAGYPVSQALGTDRAIVVYNGKNNVAKASFIYRKGDTATSTDAIDLGFTMTASFLVKLNESTLMLIYGTTARILTIDGETITVSAAESLKTYDLSSKIFKAESLNQNTVLLIHNAVSPSYCTAQVLTVNENNTITVGDLNKLNYTDTTSLSFEVFSETSAILIFHDGLSSYSSLKINGTEVINDTLSTGTYVQPATSNLHNVGVAKTGGTEGETVEVYCVV